MDDTQLLRYSRHILLNELGVEGQEKIRAGRVLLVGAGGLGSPASLYLAASGVGHITLCDGDAADLTNLQRQIALRTADVGRNKAEATRDVLRAINPEVNVDVVAERVSGSLLEGLVAAADVVLDCSDNFSTRHAVNRACVQHRKPLVSGAAIRFDAQIAVFDPRKAGGPCYECLYPETATDEEVRCAVMGVFSPLVGIVGATQAAEALKLLAGMGRSLAGRLLILNALTMEWQQLTLPQDPHCKVCGSLSETH
ncbi:MAG: HesA/MoeB/ThiF family protein [Betaproteobacteria bacterium]|nr:HesA/MoeB/ThiF family protein [Betaproteobacteria bacterium]MDE2623300.1 HesA/MoeB/ThiF family protein [Betaproteobacteria bacterium]